jgi:hypothetical protein
MTSAEAGGPSAEPGIGGDAEAVGAAAPVGPDDPDAAPGWRRSGLLVGVVGLAIGMLLGVVVIVGTGLWSRGSGAGESRGVEIVTVPRGPAPSASAADALVAAMRRSRLATFALVEDFVRVAPSGVEVVATRTTRVQRPPDSLVRTDTAVDLVRGGRHTACSTAPDSAGQLRCRSEPAPSVDVEAAVAEQASLLSGAAPLYTVARTSAGCFGLVLRVERPAPPYGRRATLCYDPATGAPSRSEITKAAGGPGEVVDRTTASAITAVVTDTDLALPAGATG